MAGITMRMANLFSKSIIWIIAAFYAYGALIHVLNMFGLSGFSWLDAPFKWQVLDVVYLVLDVAVVIGLLAGLRVGAVALFVAALSQILLYSVFRDWILDVPAEFARSPDEVAYLDVLIIFHVVTLSFFLLAMWLGKRVSGKGSS